MTDGLSLGELITSLNLPPERIAIELNQSVVRRVDWATTKLSHDDRVEIVHFVGGGSYCRLPIVDCQLPIANCRFDDSFVTDQSAIGNLQSSDPVATLYMKGRSRF